MGAGAALGVSHRAGPGLGWERVARALAEQVPPETIDRIWLFAPQRGDDREWGTAVVTARAAGGRRSVYTASYSVVLRGRERGQGRVTVTPVGESPPEVVRAVVEGVELRAGELAPPVEIEPHTWYGAPDDEPAPEG